MTANPLSSIPTIGPPSGLPQGPGGNRFRPIDPLRLLRQHALLLCVTGVVGLALGVGTYFLLLQVSPKYESAAMLEVNVARPSAYEGPAEQRAREEQLRLAINDQMAAIKGENTLNTVLEMPRVQQTRWFQSFDGDLVAARQALANEVLEAYRRRDTSYIHLAATTGQEEDARPIVRAVVDAYLAQRQVQSNRDWSELREVWQRQLREKTNEITRLQNAKDDFQRSTGISTEAGGKHPIVTEYERMAEDLDTLGTEAGFLESTVTNLQEAIRTGNFEPSADEVSEIEMRPAVAERDQRMRRIEEMLLAARGQFPDNHRHIRELEAQLDAVREAREQTFEEQSRQYLQGKLAAASKRLSSTRSVISQKQQALAELRRQKLDLSQQINEYRAIERDLVAAKDVRDELQQKLSNQEVAASRPDAVPIRLRQSPTRAELVFPKLPIVVPGVVVLALGLVSGLVFVRELLDKRIKSPTDVKAMTSGELLGTLPSVLDDPSGCREIERCVIERPAGLMAEAYRQLRTAVLSKMDRRGYKTLMLVTCQPGGGGSTVSHNLAASLARSDRRVLLIDANLRRPRQHHLFGCDGERGLVQVLRGQCTAEEVVHKVRGMSLSILPAGDTRNVAPEMFEQQAVRSMLSGLETQYDAILIDASPALITSEAQSLAKQVDALAVVAAAGRDHAGMVDRVLRELDAHRADVIGVVLNSVRAAAGGYYRRAYRTFYSYARDAPQHSGDRPTAALPPGNGRGDGGTHHEADEPSPVGARSASNGDADPR